MTIRKKMALPVAAALMALGLMVVASSAMATHPRPKAATPFYASLVPAYNQCTSGNRTHAPPLSFASCNPPVQTSPNLTMGSPDANGAPANGGGFVRLREVGVDDQGVDDTDFLVVGTLQDTRCKAGVATCGNSNAQDGPDYTGEVQVNATMRITDHNNAPTGAGPFTQTATVVDVPLPPVPGTCANTSATSEGGLCTINTSLDTICGCIAEHKRMNIELSQIKVNDGGPDGDVDTAGDNSLFEVQGIFIP